MTISDITSLLDHLQGRKTYIVCITIAVLAACQYYLKLDIPKEIWMGLFALAIAANRSAVRSLKLIALLLIPAVLLCGCTGPVPVKGGGIAVLCWYNPSTCVYLGSFPTNAYMSASGDVARDANSQPISPVQNGGVSIAIDNQTMYSCGGGTASSNTVPVSFSFNKQ